MTYLKFFHLLFWLISNNVFIILILSPSKLFWIMWHLFISFHFILLVMATTILKNLWWECLIALLLRNMFISLLLSLVRDTKKSCYSRSQMEQQEPKLSTTFGPWIQLKLPWQETLIRGYVVMSLFSLLLNTVFYFGLKVIFLKERKDFILGRNCPLLYLHTGFTGCFLRVEINGLFLLFIFLFLNELCNTLLDG